MPLIRRPAFGSPLAFPSGVLPGFDPTHPAAINCQFSAVVTQGGAGAVNLLTGLAGTNNGGGTPTIRSDIGPSRGFLSGSPNIAFNTGSSANYGAITMAAILVPSGLTGGAWWVGTSDFTSGNGYIFGSNSATATLLENNGGNAATPTITPNLTIGQPYFLATSGATVANSVNVVATNLVTGQISTGSSATALSSTPVSNGHCILGVGGGQGTLSNSTIACGMGSGVCLGLQQLLDWAQDPWSFWYPKFSIGPDMWSQYGGKIAVVATPAWGWEPYFPFMRQQYQVVGGSPR